MITITSIVIAVVLYFIGQGSSAFLIVLGIFVKLLSPFGLTFISLPGRFIAFPENVHKQNKTKTVVGMLISTCIQLFVYLAYTAFIVGWTLSGLINGANQFIIWPLAFLAVTVPIAFALKEFSKAVKETEYATKDMSKELKKVVGGPEVKMFQMLYQTTLVTALFSIACFFIFATSPEIMETIYGWVPYV